MPRPGIPDPFRTRALAEGYVARAVYKLKEIDEKYRLFRQGQRVLDLGCSPGSWLQYIASRVGPRGLVLGVDASPSGHPGGPTPILPPGCGGKSRLRDDCRGKSGF